MNLRIPLLCSAGALLAFTGAPGARQTSAPARESGVTYTFRDPLFHGFGVASLEELRGAPVLVEYWSPICPPCVGSAGVPEAIRLSQEHGGDLHVILAAALGSESQSLSFALNERWLKTPVMWTTELPVQAEQQTLPWGVLLSAEGEVVLQGNLTEMRSELDATVDRLVKQAERGPTDLPKELAKALVESSEGNFARAREIVLDEIEEAEDDGVRVQGAKRVLATVEERLDQRLSRVRWMLDNGYPIEAAETLDKLAKSVAGWEERASLVEALLAELETPRMKVEVEAQKALQKIEKRLYDDPSVRWVKQLQGVIERYPRTKSAERAKKLAKIAAI